MANFPTPQFVNASDHQGSLDCVDPPIDPTLNPLSDQTPKLPNPPDCVDPPIDPTLNTLSDQTPKLPDPLDPLVLSKCLDFLKSHGQKAVEPLIDKESKKSPSESQKDVAEDVEMLDSDVGVKKSSSDSQKDLVEDVEMLDLNVGVMKSSSGSQKDVVVDVEMVDIGMKKLSSGSQKDVVVDVQMVDIGVKKSLSEEEDESTNFELKNSASRSSGAEVVGASQELVLESFEDDQEFDPKIAENESESDASEDDQADPPKQSSSDLSDEEEGENEIGIESQKPLLASNLSLILAEPFELRRSSRNAAKKNMPNLKLPTPLKLSNIKRKPTLKRGPILLQASVWINLYSEN